MGCACFLEVSLACYTVATTTASERRKAQVSRGDDEGRHVNAMTTTIQDASKATTSIVLVSRGGDEDGPAVRLALVEAATARIRWVMASSLAVELSRRRVVGGRSLMSLVRRRRQQVHPRNLLPVRPRPCRWIDDPVHNIQYVRFDVHQAIVSWPSARPLACRLFSNLGWRSEGLAVA